jgi:hypothetical protein
MPDTRPDRVYGIIVRDGRVFLRDTGRGYGLPGGVFRPLAEDRKTEIRAHLFDQLGVVPLRTWAQGAFMYRDAAEDDEAFSGFYTVWDWSGEVPDAAGLWVDREMLPGIPGLPGSLRILLLSVLETVAIKTT